MRLLVLLALGVSICGSSASSGALAQTKIGSAAAVVPAVTSSSGALVVGSSVFFNETIRAAAGGETELEFLDRTKLTVGRGSTVKLDRFVFNPDGNAKQFVVSLTKGTFRFITGGSPKSAYEIRTANATLGVRGTRVVIGVTNALTSIRVEEGQVIICNLRVPHDSVRHRSEDSSRNCLIVPSGGEGTVYADGHIVNQAIGLDGPDPGSLIREASLGSGPPGTPPPPAGGLGPAAVIGGGLVFGGAAALAASSIANSGTETPVSP
jgi:hypothetical protein